MKKTIYYVTPGIFLLFSIHMDLAAQESPVSAGGTLSGSSGSLSYSIGQTAYQLYSGNLASLQFGVQQAYEISSLDQEEAPEQIQLLYQAYPNPTEDEITLAIENMGNEKLFYELYDLKGARLDKHLIVDLQTSIPMQQLAAATYLLFVKSEQNTLKTFRIIKH